jgi:hypothetical protein
MGSMIPAPDEIRTGIHCPLPRCQKGARGAKKNLDHIKGSPSFVIPNDEGLEFMIASSIQITACLILIGASLYWWSTRKATVGAYRFLLPAVVASSVAGLVVAYTHWAELFVLWYSGAIYEAGGTPSLGLTIEQYAITASVLMILPALAIIRGIGRNALLVAMLGCLACVPKVSNWLFPWSGC